MEKHISSAVLLLLSSVFLLSAQNDRDDFMRSYEDFYKSQDDAYRQFSDWRSKANAEFSDYLAAAWQEFMVLRGKEDPVGPVPDEPVYYDAADAGAMPHGLPSCGLDAAPVVPSQLPAVSASYRPGGAVSIDFFGLSADVPFVESMRLPRIMATEQGASKGWNVLSESEFMPVLEALTAMRDRYSLSDWALYTAIKKYTEAVYIDEYVNERILTQMFLLSQMKFKARIGSSGGSLVLLLPFSAPVYQVSYISDGDEDFYIFSYSRLNSQNPLYTFSDDFSAADHAMSLVIDRQLSVGEDDYREVRLPAWSAYMGEDISVPLNMPCVNFTLDYPQTDLLTYHKSAVDPRLQKEVFNRIRYRKLKEGMSDMETVAFILGLVQKGFDYKTDYEMFGRSKPLFVEESFYYGANNCKDRVLLFSWMVKDILGMDVVMFSYKGHVACGVYFPEDVAGDGFVFEGRRYVMCDPTYIGAPIGATMPKYRDVSPAIVRL